jgi:hypothetical protein
MRNAILVMGIVLIGVSANLGLLPMDAEPQGIAAASGSSTLAQLEKHGKKAPGNDGDAEVNDNPIMTLYEVDDPNNVYYKDGVAADLCKNSKADGTSTFEPKYCLTPEGRKPEYWGKLRNENVDIVIAAVPDPVETRLTVLFDRSMEAILSAASENCYAFDRSWVP